MVFVVSLVVGCYSRDHSSGNPVHTERFVGFAVFGPEWPTGKTFASETDRLIYLEEQGYLVAQHTSRLYGNMVRIPVYVWSVVGKDLLRELTPKPVYQMEDAAISEALAKIEPFLQTSLAALEKDHNTEGGGLYWGATDAFLAGIQKYNREIATQTQSGYHPVYVDLLLTDIPPALIVEAPFQDVLKSYGCQTSGEAVWRLYKHVHAAFVKRLVQRYGRGYSSSEGPASIPVAAAIEMFNEPDYSWMPDEQQFEKAMNPHAYPCDKYISQLHLSQIPAHDLPNKGCGMREGQYREQDSTKPSVDTPLKDFRWGRKFDKYIAYFTELHDFTAMAAQAEIKRGQARMVVAGSSVTHVNLDWFMRMYRANASAFRSVDTITIHPYHWPQHDVHDTQYVRTLPTRDWRSVSPREFAGHYAKQFNFLEELARLTEQRDQAASLGMAGKPIWVTEFGLATKKLGKTNDAYRHNPRTFIYDRATPIPDDVRALVWEDMWESFFAQVSPAYLRRNHIATFLLYTLRESSHSQTNDDDHSNFSFYSADWTPRMAPETLERLAEFFRQFRDG